MGDVANTARVVVVRSCACGIPSAGDVVLTVELVGPLSEQRESAIRHYNIPEEKRREEKAGQA